VPVQFRALGLGIVPVCVPKLRHWGSEAVAGPLTAAMPHCRMETETETLRFAARLRRSLRAGCAEAGAEAESGEWPTQPPPLYRMVIPSERSRSRARSASRVPGYS